MTRGRKRTPGHRMVVVVLATSLAVSAFAFADHWDGNGATSTLGYTPDFRVTTGGLIDKAYNTQFTYTQNPNEDVTSKYVTHVPTGFRFSVGSVKTSTYPSCAAMSPDVEAGAAATINNKVEAIGEANLALSTMSSNGATVWFTGESYFLKYTPTSPTTGVTTICTLVSTGAAAITPGAANNNNRLIFQSDLTLNGDRSWDLVSTLKAVPGLAPGTHSVLDNPYYQGQNVSIRDVSIELGGYTEGNFNTDPATGQKKKIPFALTPVSAGTYNFVGTAYPCGADPLDPPLCKSNAAPVSIVRSLGFSNSLTPVHAMPLIQTPAKFSGPWSKPIVGTNKVPVSWTKVADTPHDTIKGYLVTTGIKYQPSQIHFDYFITNPSASGYNPLQTNPCGADGAAATCAFELSFPLATTNGGELPVNGVYSTSIVAIYMDGHRSDGKCDDGTGPGLPPPCADGHSPQITYPDGFTFVEYVLRSKAWPLKYGQTAGSGYNGQLNIILLDLDNHKGEYIISRPYGVTYPFEAFTINGSNANSIGEILFIDNNNTQGKGFGIQGIVNGTTLSAYIEFFCPTTLAWINCSRLPGVSLPTSFSKL